jgi:hypothetical protein
VGVDPRPFSWAQLARMARGKDEAEWNRTRALVEYLNTWWSKTPLDPMVCQPYYERQPLTPEEEAIRFDEFCRAVETAFRRV